MFKIIFIKNVFDYIIPDVTLINDAKIVMEAIQLEPANLGTVYVINRIFTTFQEIEAVMDKNRPQPGSIKDQAQSPA